MQLHGATSNRTRKVLSPGDPAWSPPADRNDSPPAPTAPPPDVHLHALGLNPHRGDPR